ncbi:MAG: PAS domain-containing protein [bacterium]|nr:PAS domain-containing protein [bacterium]
MDPLTFIFAGAFLITLVLLIRSLFRQAGAQDAIKQTTEEAADRFKLWEEFGQHLDEGVALVDPDGNVEYSNQSFATMTGWEGRSSFHQPLETVLSIVQDGKPLKLTERKRQGTVTAQDGTLTPAYAAKRSLTHPPGYQVVTLLDATTEQAEKELRKRLVNLSSFELRAPITAMKGYADLLLSGDAGKLPKDALSKVQTILDSANKLLRIIEDMARIETLSEEKIAVRKQRIAAKKLFTGVSDKLAATVAESSRKLDAGTPGTDAEIEVDVTEVSRLLSMIANTAARTAAPKSEVTFNLQETAPEVEFRIENQGAPLARDQQQNVFDYVGAQGFEEGIGYYIAQQIIEAHHARFSVTGTNTGNAFVLSLPKAAAETEEASDSSEGKAAARGGKQIDIGQ